MHMRVSAAGLHNMLAWRDANMPGTPVWVTEWGWDAARPGEGCGASTECVSQLAQAAYGIRGLALLARKGVAASHWFFYASESAFVGGRGAGDNGMLSLLLSTLDELSSYQ
jgi:hypothetical protein